MYSKNIHYHHIVYHCFVTVITCTKKIMISTLLVGWFCLFVCSQVKKNKIMNLFLLNKIFQAFGGGGYLLERFYPV